MGSNYVLILRYVLLGLAITVAITYYGGEKVHTRLFTS
jgi:hypothetical protein